MLVLLVGLEERRFCLAPGVPLAEVHCLPVGLGRHLARAAACAVVAADRDKDRDLCAGGARRCATIAHCHALPEHHHSDREVEGPLEERVVTIDRCLPAAPGPCDENGVA